jgi:hypothetical protein
LSMQEKEGRLGVVGRRNEAVDIAEVGHGTLNEKARLAPRLP